VSIGQSELLELYGLYKQVTCFGEFDSAVKPSFWRFGECRKYWSWERNSKLSKYEALEGYIKLVRRVCPEWKYDPTVRVGTGSNPMIKTVSKMKPQIDPNQKDISKFFALARYIYYIRYRL